MIKNIIELLESKNNVDEYKITETKTTSTELFFIKDELNMTRGKDVLHINLTVYRNFEKDGKKFKGSSNTKVSPTMTLEEISKKVDNASLAASFVYNEYYDLVEPTNDVPKKLESKFGEGNVIKHISNLVKDLYSKDNIVEGAFINSCEFFINEKHIRIANSKGLDVEYDAYSGQIELITESKSGVEEVELFEVLDFSDYDALWIKETVKETLLKTKLRAQAVPLKAVKDIPVILTGEAVKTFFNYYGIKASSQLVYQGISHVKIGDMIQSGDIIGDKVSGSLNPDIKNSTHSKYYDSDGLFLKEIIVVEDGKLLRFLANKRFADYLKIEPTGEITNIVIKAGSKSIEELTKEPQLKLLNFSDFQMDAITGNFGGEIRLGLYFDGKTSTPVTLGSLTGNATKVEQEMYFSKELQKLNGFVGPKIIKIKNVTIAGN